MGFEKVNIIVCSDGTGGSEIASHLQEMKLQVREIRFDEAFSVDTSEGISIYIFYLGNDDSSGEVMQIIGNNDLRQNLKFLIGSPEMRSFFKDVLDGSGHVEYFSTPLHVDEFLFSVEKSVAVEQYRQSLKDISKSSTSRLEVFRNIIESEDNEKTRLSREREFFFDLVDFEKKIILEQVVLNESIREMAVLRSMDCKNMTERVRAEELLDGLRRKELLEANKIIEAQGNLIDHSSKELHEANRIIDARESVQELSRNEKMLLKKEIENLKKENLKLQEKIGFIESQNKTID